MIAEKYNLDKERCFVIPHAYTPFNSCYTRKKGDIIKILYTGTFYKSAFTKEFKREEINKLIYYRKSLALYKKLRWI